MSILPVSTTPKIDIISVEMSRKVGHPVNNATDDTDSLKSIERMSYINKAMFKMINDVWMKLKGDTEVFVNMFPELIVKTSALTLSSGNYTIISPYLDFFKLIDGKTEADVYIKRWHETLFMVAETGKNLNYIATASDPSVIQLKNMLYFYPKNSTFTPTILYIKVPVNPTSGNYLTQGGQYDSPFFDHRNEEISQIAADLFLQDAQEI